MTSSCEYHWVINFFFDTVDQNLLQLLPIHLSG